MTPVKKKKIHPGSVVFVILIFLLSVILLGEGFYIFSELQDDSDLYVMDESNYIRLATYEEYYRLYSETAYDCAPDRRFTATQNELRALGLYYEAASLYKAYAAVGDEASCDRQLARMERYREEAGSYAGEADKIDARLGL